MHPGVELISVYLNKPAWIFTDPDDIPTIAKVTHIDNGLNLFDLP